ncbi:MAG: hypothetical protein JW786_03530 [Desulfobacterales bacterium]|nr:hypothetical protein [Desulfobacterales bacterium]
MIIFDGLRFLSDKNRSRIKRVAGGFDHLHKSPFDQKQYFDFDQKIIIISLHFLWSLLFTLNYNAAFFASVFGC